MNARWLTSDSLVRDGIVKRSWLWGPLADGVTGLMEPYKEAPNGWRWVEYFDKTRMEVTDPNKALTDPYYVTNGLLVKEMVTGNLQLGDNTFESKGAAQIPAAGDLSSVNPSPRFADYASLLNRNDNQTGKSIVETLDKGGVISTDTSLEGKYGIYPGIYVADTSHYIASPFWQYLNSTGPLLDSDNGGQQITGKLFDPLFYATGYPITEAYWTKTTVGGVEKDVLVQMFERRVLTYTPSNPSGFQVEMGNVGLEYYNWRYGSNS